MKSKSIADEYLISKKWLDTGTRRLYMELKIYTPNMDSITIVEVRMSTECGFFYTITRDDVS